MKRLTGPSGSLYGVATATPPGQSDRVIRKAILVHAGADGGTLEFMSGDGPITFDPARIQRIVKNQNALLDSLIAEYGGVDKVPPGAWPPLLDQHSEDSNDRIIGRMMAHLRYEVLDVPKVGKSVPCAVTDLTFLGEDTVKRVADGRIHHLSIGIDEATDTLGETSAVIDPAAPGAMLLSAGRKTPKKERQMPGAKNLARMQRSAKRLATLENLSGQLVKMQSELKGSAELVRMTKREGEVTHRLSALMKKGRLTPAEYKKMDVKKLAKLDDSALDTVVGSFEVREPVIDPHQRGSKTAEDFASIGKNMEKKKLKAMAKETMKDLMSASGGKIKLKAGSHLEDIDKDHGDTHEMGRLSGPHEEEAHPGKDPHAVEGEEKVDMASFKKHMSECKKHMESGDFDKAKESHMAAMKHMGEDGEKHMSFGVGDTKSEDYKKGMDAMEAKVDELSTNLARLAGAVGELMDVEKEEGHELAAHEGEPEHEVEGQH